MMSEQARGLRQDAFGEDLPEAEASDAREPAYADDDLEYLDLQAEDGEALGEPLKG
jgi:hypothetical protein